MDSSPDPESGPAPRGSSDPKYEVVVVGAGLAGAVCAWRLGADRRVLLLEAEHPGAGASGAAAGLAHRFLGARPRLVWRSGDALDGLRALLAEIEATDLFRERGDYREGTRVRAVDERDGRPALRLDRGERISADRVILAVGAGYRELPILRRRGFTVIKGQTLSVEPPWPTDGLPSLVGPGYAAIFEERIVLGTTYERDFAHLRPDEAGTRRIRATTAELQAAFADAPIRSRTAGGRVKAPGHRKASIGPLSDRPQVWLTGALGAKGLLLAGLLARRIETWYRDPDTIPERLSVPDRSSDREASPTSE